MCLRREFATTAAICTFSRTPSRTYPGLFSARLDNRIVRQLNETRHRPSRFHVPFRLNYATRFFAFFVYFGVLSKRVYGRYWTCFIKLTKSFVLLIIGKILVRLLCFTSRSLLLIRNFGRINHHRP